MSGNRLEVIDHSNQVTYEWVRDLSEMLGWGDPKHVLLLLRNVLTGVRDHLPHDESAHLAAQLPLLLRGMYYEGWRPAQTPLSDRSRKTFVYNIEKRVSMHHEYKGVDDIITVLRFLGGVITAGEVEDVKHALPSQIRDLWPD